MAESVGVSILAQLLDDGSDRRDTSRIVRRHGTSDSREQERTVETGILGRPLPISRGVQRRGRSRSHDLVGQERPLRGRRTRRGSQSPGRSAEAGGTDQPAVGPNSVVDLPDPGICVLPPLRNGISRNLRRLLTAEVEAIEAGSRSEEQECFAEGIELELLVDVVADKVKPSRIAGQVDAMLIGNRRPVSPVGGGEHGAIIEEAGGNESRRCRGAHPRRGDGLSGVGLIADPYVAIIVVAALLCPLRQRSGSRRHHPPSTTGQAPHHRVGECGTFRIERVSQVGDTVPRPLPWLAKSWPGRGTVVIERLCGKLEHKIEGLTGETTARA